MIEKIKMYAEEIAEIIQDAKDIQDSNESAYTKEKAVINAYYCIAELVGGE